MKNSPQTNAVDSLGLFSPLMLAAYVTWLAVLLGLLKNSASTGVLPAQLSYGLALGFHCVFLLAFVLHTRSWSHSWLPDVLLGLQLLLVLVLCLLQRNGLLPVLTVIVVPSLVERMGMPKGLWLSLLFNLLLWWVLAQWWRLELALVWVLAFGGFQLFATIMIRTIEQKEKQRQQQAVINAELIATRHLLEISTRDQERLRLSRELHDVAGHKLTALKLQLSMLQATEQQQPTLQLCQALTTELLDDIRGVVAHLRKDNAPDLQTLLEQQIRAFPKPHVTLQLASLQKQVNTSIAHVLLRAVQEALTNSARHSTATQMWITLQQQNDQLLLTIEDNGRTTLQPVLGNGLSGMQERFATLGGSLRIAPTANLGFGLYGTLPLLP